MKKEDRGESDRIFTVFTQDFGKLELLARAERKIQSKLRSGLELFYLSEIEFIQGKSQKTVTDAILLDSCKSRKSDLLKLSACHRAAETLDALVKFGERDEKLWTLLSDFFAVIDESRQKIQTLGISLHYFLWNLFMALGYGPDLQICLYCRKKVSAASIFFSAQDGGLICEDCRHLTKSGVDVSINVVKIVRIFLQKNWPLAAKLKVGRNDLKAIKNFSDYYLEEIFAKIS